MSFSEIIKGIIGLVIIGVVISFFVSKNDPNQLLKEGDSSFSLGEYAKAAEKFREVCQDQECQYQNYACTNLARVAEYYYDGIDVQKNTQKAIELFKVACKNGNMQSCVILGGIFIKEKDEKQSRKFYKYACDMGSGDSCAIYKKLLEIKGEI